MSSTSRVVIYSTSHCGFCRRAEDLLRREGIAFDVIDVTHDRHARATLMLNRHVLGAPDSLPPRMPECSSLARS